MVMQMGQFIDHDIAHTPFEQNNGQTCCAPQDKLAYPGGSL